MYGVLGRGSLKRMAERLKFAQQLNKPQDFWNNVLRTDETKLDLFGHE